MATIGTRIYTLLNGQAVGSDRFGNRYYQERRVPKDRRRRRWVVYRGLPEASKVPPEWHGWLHHLTDALPDDLPVRDAPWMKPHLPNLTGTEFAYRPPGHPLKGGVREPAASDYEPWQP